MCGMQKPEAPVNDGSNYNCLKVGKFTAFIKFDYMLETPIESDTTRNGKNVIGATAYA